MRDRVFKNSGTSEIHSLKIFFPIWCMCVCEFYSFRHRQKLVFLKNVINSAKKDLIKSQIVLKNKAYKDHRITENLTHPHWKHGKMPWNHHKSAPHQVLGGKTVKIVQIDSQTTDIWLKELTVPLLREWVCDIYVIREKLSF